MHYAHNFVKTKNIVLYIMKSNFDYQVFYKNYFAKKNVKENVDINFKHCEDYKNYKNYLKYKKEMKEENEKNNKLNGKIGLNIILLATFTSLFLMI